MKNFREKEEMDASTEPKNQEVRRLRREIIRVIRQNEDGISAPEIAEKLGIGTVRVRRIIDGISCFVPIWEEGNLFGWLRRDNTL